MIWFGRFKIKALTDHLFEYTDIFKKFASKSENINDISIKYGIFVDLLFDIGIQTIEAVNNSAFIGNYPLISSKVTSLTLEGNNAPGNSNSWTRNKNYFNTVKVRKVKYNLMIAVSFNQKRIKLTCEYPL